MRDRMNPMHNDMLRKMLGLNELPEFLLKRYFAIKKLTDKVDAPFTPMDLLRMALDCGLNLETRKFNNGEQHTFSAEDVGNVAEPEPEVPEVEEDLFKKPKGYDAIANSSAISLDESPEKEPEQEVIEEPAKVVSESEPEPEPEEDKPIRNGQEVNAFTEDGEIVRGHINGHKKIDGKMYYTVLTDDGGVLGEKEVVAEDIEVI